MSKTAVVFWSGTGNTEIMADQILEGMKGAGADAQKYTPDDFQAGMVEGFDAIAFGCPAMGDEVLEETEFEPMFSACLPNLKGKKIALFGSYGWGDGEWMRNWEEDCKKAGAVLVSESVMSNEEPGDEENEACRALGKALAEA